MVELIPIVESIPAVESILLLESIPTKSRFHAIPIPTPLVVIPIPIPIPVKNGIITPLVVFASYCYSRQSSGLDPGPVTSPPYGRG